MSSRRMAGIGLTFVGLALFAASWMTELPLLPVAVVLVFLPMVLVVLFGAGREPRRLGCWIVPLVVVTGLLVACLRMPKLSRGGPVEAWMFKAELRNYGRETDDYPRNARELVRDVVPRKFAGGYWQITAVSDDRLLVEHGRFRKEVEYRYVSPDYVILVWEK